MVLLWKTMTLNEKRMKHENCVRWTLENWAIEMKSIVIFLLMLETNWRTTEKSEENSDAHSNKHRTFTRQMRNIVFSAMLYDSIDSTMSSLSLSPNPIHLWLFSVWFFDSITYTHKLSNQANPKHFQAPCNFSVPFRFRPFLSWVPVAWPRHLCRRCHRCCRRQQAQLEICVWSWNLWVRTCRWMHYIVKMRESIFHRHLSLCDTSRRLWKASCHRHRVVRYTFFHSLSLSLCFLLYKIHRKTHRTVTEVSDNDSITVVLIWNLIPVSSFTCRFCSGKLNEAG